MTALQGLGLFVLDGIAFLGSRGRQEALLESAGVLSWSVGLGGWALAIGL